jgi:hypothetical protein
MIHTYIAPKEATVNAANSKVIVSWPAWVEMETSGTSDIRD